MTAHRRPKAPIVCSRLQPPGAWDSACAGAVLRCTVAMRPEPAPAVTLNLVRCVFTTPPSSSSEEARAHSEKSPGPLANHRQPSPSLAILVLHAIPTHHTLEAPAPTRRVTAFTLFPLPPRLPASRLRVCQFFSLLPISALPPPRLAGRLAAHPLASSAAVACINPYSTRLHDVTTSRSVHPFFDGSLSCATLH